MADTNQPAPATTEDHHAWSPSDLPSYRAGTIVSDGGRLWRAKSGPTSAWATMAAYRPSGINGSQAWEEFPG